MKKLIFFLVFLLISGCAAIEQMNQSDLTRYNQTQYQPTPDTVKVPIVDRANIERPFTVIAEVRDKVATIYDSEAEAIARMKAAARKVGGRALVDFETRTVDESTDWIPEPVTYYTAKVLVYSSGSE